MESWGIVGEFISELIDSDTVEDNARLRLDGIDCFN